METNNYNTDLQTISQEYPYEEESLQTKKGLENQRTNYCLPHSLLPLCHLSDSFFLCLPSDTYLDRYDRTRLSLIWGES